MALQAAPRTAPASQTVPVQDSNPDHDAATPDATSRAPRELVGHATVATWLDTLCAAYADDVRWSAPRRGVAFAGRTNVVAALVRELAAMSEPRVNVLRHTTGRTQSFHEFTIRFHLVAPGIEGVNLPLGAEIELERLRVLTHAGDGRVAVETCIETWTWLSARKQSTG
jgi:hypothetical protein